MLDQPLYWRHLTREKAKQQIVEVRRDRFWLDYVLRDPSQSPIVEMLSRALKQLAHPPESLSTPIRTLLSSRRTPTIITTLSWLAADYELKAVALPVLPEGKCMRMEVAPPPL